MRYEGNQMYSFSWTWLNIAWLLTTFVIFLRFPGARPDILSCDRMRSSIVEDYDRNVLPILEIIVIVFAETYKCGWQDICTKAYVVKCQRTWCEQSGQQYKNLPMEQRSPSATASINVTTTWLIVYASLTNSSWEKCNYTINGLLLS